MNGRLTRTYDEIGGFPGFGRVFADFDRLFRELDQRPYSAGGPEVTTVNSETGYELSVDLPGLADADVKLEVHQGVLTVSGARRVSAPEGYQSVRRERRGHQFSRSFTLPDEVDVDGVKAAIKHGVLKVTLPKRPEVKPRQIPVSLG